MSKYRSIFIKIKLFYLILSGRISVNTNRIQINKNNNINFKNVLIVFPVKEDDFRVAAYVFRSLSKTENINYYFLINSIFKQHFHLRGYIFDIYYSGKKNKIIIDETFYEDRILNKEYDLIIDLNNEFLFEVSYLINKLHAIYKIGLKNKYADYFYNIQYNVNSNDILEKVYRKIYLMIREK